MAKGNFLVEIKLYLKALIKRNSEKQVFFCKFPMVFRNLLDRAAVNDYEKRLHFESLKETCRIWKTLEDCKSRVK